MIQELRHALRSLTQRPGFALAAILTLGLDLGANIVIFDLLNLVSWQRPPVEKPGDLLRIHTRSRAEWIGPYGNSSYGDYLDYRASAESFSGLAAVLTSSPRLRTGEVSQPVRAGLVSANYFELLGVGAAAGRVLGSADGEADNPPAIVLSHPLWQQLFGKDRETIGSVVRLDDQAFTIVGVAAEGFYGTFVGNRLDLWLPVEHDRDTLESAENRNRGWAGIVGRLRPGATPDGARQEIRRIAAGLDQTHPLVEREREVTVAPVTLTHPLDRRNFLPTLRILLVGVALLLLITCANVANLLLARNASRGREIGVRAALGASRWRLARQLLSESLVLAAAGGATGLLLAHWARRLVALVLGSELTDFVRELRFDLRVLGLALVVCLISAVLSGLAPVRAVARADLVSAIHSGALGHPARGRRWATGDALVVAQVALATVLLVASGLLAQSMWNLWRADPGFETRNLLSISSIVDSGQRSREEGRALHREMVERAAALPGVRAAGLAMLVPPVLLDITSDFRLAASPLEKRTARRNVVDAGFFKALGIPLQEGRLFTAGDTDSDHGIVVVNRNLAGELWPDEDPLGQILLLEQRRSWEPGEYEVVGVVGDTVQDSFDSSAQPILYFSAGQRYRPSMDLVLRAETDPMTLVAPLREALRQIDPSLTLERARTQEDIRWGYLALERIRTLVLASFAVLGLVLAVVGVGSVLAYAVHRRMREIGIRMALGARVADVRRLVLGRGLSLTLAGLGLGGLVALWVTRLLRGFLFGIGATDPRIFGGVALVLIAAALAAAWLPAWRASRVDPLIAVRHE